MNAELDKKTEKSILKQEARANFQIPLIDRLWQCQHRLERSYARAQRELERLQNSRRHAIHPPEETTPAPQPAAKPAAASQPQPAPKAPYVMSSPAAAPAAPSAPRVEPRHRTAAS